MMALLLVEIANGVHRQDELVFLQLLFLDSFHGVGAPGRIEAESPAANRFESTSL
jgi:hypothetical protein